MRVKGDFIGKFFRKQAAKISLLLVFAMVLSFVPQMAGRVQASGVVPPRNSLELAFGGIQAMEVMNNYQHTITINSVSINDTRGIGVRLMSELFFSTNIQPTGTGQIVMIEAPTEAAVTSGQVDFIIGYSFTDGDGNTVSRSTRIPMFVFLQGGEQEPEIG